MKLTSPFKGRTIAVVNDLSTDEQLYLYNKTKALKTAIANNSDLSAFKINNPNVRVYLLFLEDSTRTKESFRNAANFHDIKLNVLQNNMKTIYSTGNSSNCQYIFHTISIAHVYYNDNKCYIV